jgi:hypothetical protein
MIGGLTKNIRIPSGLPCKSLEEGVNKVASTRFVVNPVRCSWQTQPSTTFDARRNIADIANLLLTNKAFGTYSPISPWLLTQFGAIPEGESHCTNYAGNRHFTSTSPQMDCQW